MAKLLEGSVVATQSTTLVFIVTLLSCSVFFVFHCLLVFVMLLTWGDRVKPGLFFLRHGDGVATAQILRCTEHSKFCIEGTRCSAIHCQATGGLWLYLCNVSRGLMLDSFVSSCQTVNNGK